jgi:hypothetical protein
MANAIIDLLRAPSGTFTNGVPAPVSLMPFIKARSWFGGKGYIAGSYPGTLTVDGSPAERPLELRLREMNRNLIAKTYSNPTDGTYRFSDLDPYTKFDLIARDEPNYVYNDVIIGGIWPWTDDELIMHGPPSPTDFLGAFSRTYEITGGTLPYSVSVSSYIPSGVTVTLVDRMLTITSASDPGETMTLVLADSSTVTKTVTITSTTVSAGDPLWDNVSILVTMTGSEGSTVFNDLNPNTTRTWTPANASIDTDSFPGGAGDFTNANSELATPDHASLDISSGEWCVEAFVKTPATHQDWETISSKDHRPSISYWTHAFAIMAGGVLRFSCGNGINTAAPAMYDSATGAVPTSAFVHLAVQRVSRSGTWYYEGFVGVPGTMGARVFQLPEVYSPGVGSGTQSYLIGRLNGAVGPGSLVGLMKGYRVTRAARYANSPGYTTPYTFPTYPASYDTTHPAYRLNITAANGSSYCSLSEFEMTNRAGQRLTIGGIANSSSVYAAGYEAAKAFDGNTTSTQWSSSSGLPQWLSYQFTSPRSAYEFKLTASMTLNEAPKAFTIQTTEDGVSWDDRWCIYNQTGWTANETRFFRFEDYRAANVSAVMKATAANNATTMTDIKGNTYTFGSTAKVGLAVGSGFGRSFIQFTDASTNASVVTTNNAALGILGGDFTVEAFVLYTGADPSGTYGYHIIGSDNNAADGWQLRMTATGLEASFPGSASATLAQTWVANTVYHVYWSRVGTQHYLGVDGTGTAKTLTNRTTNGTTAYRLGAQSYGGGWVGKMIHRVTKGFARYTTGTYQIPPAPFPEFSETPYQYTLPGTATTKSLIHFDGLNGATSITDQRTRTWTVGGNAKLSNEKSRFGGTALRIYDADSFFSCPAGILTASDKFCLEGWIWCDPVGGAGGSSNPGGYTLCGQGGAGGAQDQQIRAYETGMLQYYRGPSIGGEGEKRLESAPGTIKLGMWNHVMLTYDGATLRLYANGNRVGELTATSGWINTGQVFTLGYQIVQGYPEYRTGHKGFIDEFRILVGHEVVSGSSYAVPVGPY